MDIQLSFFMRRKNSHELLVLGMWMLTTNFIFIYGNIISQNYNTLMKEAIQKFAIELGYLKSA